VKYKEGTSNKVADALSRCVETAEVAAMSVNKPRWLEIIVVSENTDPQAKELLAQLSVSSPNANGYALYDGVIKYNNRIWLGNHKEAKDAIMLALHNIGIGGHSGFTTTYNKIRALFAWNHMKQEIKTYVAHCTVCQQAKSEHVGSPGLLQPLPIPHKAWEIISLDFVEGLPKSSKSLTVAQAYVDHVYKLHGLPYVIISDRDKVFTSLFWQQLFKITNTTLNMSSSYHPQTDGQTERLNQCMETYLCCMTQSCPQKWAKWLPLAEFWYNTTFHSAQGKSPFEVLYGYKPTHFGLQDISVHDATVVPDLESWLKDRDDMQRLVQQNLLCT
jgi:hypothetical protein